MIRVVIGDRHIRPSQAPAFDVWFGRKWLGRHNCPVFEAARALLALGVDPAARMVAVHRETGVDVFRPAPVGQLARLTVAETNRSGLQRMEWRPHPRAQNTPPAT